MRTKTVRNSPQKKTASSKKHGVPKVTTRSSQKSLQTVATSQRQPQKCQKCPGQPLRSKCVHTKRGKEFLIQQGAIESLREDSPVNEQTEDSPTRASPPIHNLVNVSAPALPRTSDASYNSNPFFSYSPPALPRPEPSASSSHLASLGSISSGQELATPQSDFSSASGGVLGPGPATPSPGSVQSVQVMTSTDLANISLRSVSSLSSTTSSSRPSRTSAHNPYNGHVQGAYRGSAVYQIVRGHCLPSPISDNMRSVKRFTNKINSIIEKCEDISKETGCWLFIGAQHATARAGAISYASPRLRRDAAEQVGNIGTQFSTLTRNLIHARTQETLQLQLQLDQSRREAEEMKKSLEAATASQKELASILGRFRERYNLDSDDL